MSNRSTIYILYNAKASVLGKLSYARKKLSAPANDSPCHACDLTHGGLRLDETAEWKAAKKRIDANVEQLHIDELTDELNAFVKTNELRFPVILGRSGAGGSPLKVLVDSEALSSVSKDHEAFLAALSKSAEREDIPLSVQSHATQ